MSLGPEEGARSGKTMSQVFNGFACTPGPVCTALEVGEGLNQRCKGESYLNVAELVVSPRLGRDLLCKKKIKNPSTKMFLTPFQL